MKRREALKKTSWMLASCFMVPSVLTLFESCEQEIKDVHTRNLLVFNDRQDDLIKAIADTMIPKTETPNATEVDVNKFIDILLSHVFEEKTKNNFIKGLEEFDTVCKSITGSSYTKLSTENQYNYLNDLDQEIMSKSYEGKAPFYFLYKQLVIYAYFSSKEGVKQNLDYIPIPGPYISDQALTETTKRQIGNRM